MSYRITLNRPPVVECDTAEEVFALAALAMDRQAERLAADEGDVAHDQTPTMTVRRAPEPKRLAAEPVKKSARNAAKEVRAFLEKAGVARRVSQICAELGFDEAAVRAVLDGPDYLQMGRGFYRLADAEEKPAKATTKPTPAIKPRWKEPTLEDSPAPDNWDDPAAVTQSSDPTLVEKIRKFLAKNGAMGVSAIALSIDEREIAVKDTMRSNPGIFRLHPRAGGWELVP
jgi:hypothetical protein